MSQMSLRQSLRPLDAPRLSAGHRRGIHEECPRTKSARCIRRALMDAGSSPGKTTRARRTCSVQVCGNGSSCHAADPPQRARLDRIAGARGGVRRRLSGSADQARCGAGGRRARRHRGAGVRAVPRRSARPERLHREPHRRLERHRHRGCRARRAGRLHAAVRIEFELCGQSGGDEKSPLRYPEGPQARRPRLLHAARAGGSRVACR